MPDSIYYYYLFYGEKNEGMVRGILVIRLNREEKQEERGYWKGTCGLTYQKLPIIFLFIFYLLAKRMPLAEDQGGLEGVCPFIHRVEVTRII
jgi:hypothetical protein